MSVSVPGRIVVVDNIEEDVKDTIKSFWEAGEGVTFFQSIPDENKIPPNVRVLILDIALSGEELRLEEDIQQLALILRHVVRKTKLCLVVLWSAHIKNGSGDIIDRIKNEYKAQTDTDIPPTIFFIQHGKTAIDRNRLAEEIRKWLNENPYAGIVFEWERLIEDARDTAVSDIVSTQDINSLVKSIEEESGKEAMPREIVSLFNKILQRHIINETKITPLKLCAEKLLEQQSGTEKILEWYSNLHYLNAYYKIAQSEPVWTGDIFRTSNSDPYREYAIIITPACDFAQKKVDRFKVVYGLKFKEISDYNPEEEENIPSVVRKIGKTGRKKEAYRSRKEIINMLIKWQNLPAKFYILYFLKERIDSGFYFHLLLDFQNVDSFETQPSDWNKICRVDSPWIDDILQKYASLSARIGIPNIPEDVKEAELKKTQS